MAEYALTLSDVKAPSPTLLLQDLRERLAGRGVKLELSEEAREFVAREGYDPVFGARPLKRFLQHQLKTRIGRALIAGDVTDGSLIEVGLKDGALDVAVREVRPTGREAPTAA